MNDLSTNNIATSSVMPSNNISTSDELTAPEIYSADGDSKYAIKRRKSKLSKTTVTLLTISVSAVAGGTVLTNVFIGDAPVINNFDSCYEVVEQTFKYNLDITVKVAKLEMSLNSKEATLQDYVFDSTGVFTGEYALPSSGTYEVKFYSTNLFDYKSELKQYYITFII